MIDAGERVTKRRSGEKAGALPVADPRPEVEGRCVLGVRCRDCRHPSPQVVPRCPACFGEVEPARFGPEGTVWASTVVHLPVLDREPPFALAYVDLDDGPRVLAHLPSEEIVAPGTRVAVTGDDDGDIEVEVVS